MARTLRRWDLNARSMYALVDKESVLEKADTDFDAPPQESGINVFAGLADDLADVLRSAGSDGIRHYGYAEHVADLYAGMDTDRLF